jgi:diguanylate cyclase (GGDEF)-like protein
LVHPEDAATVERGQDRVDATGVVTLTYRFLRSDRTYSWVEERSRRVSNDEWTGQVSSVRTADIVGGHTLSRFDPNIDPLTGAQTRSAFMDRVAAAIRRLEQPGTVLALIGLDLDRFNRINVALGHEAGDLVLREAATRIETALGSEASMARVAGDEFMALVVGEDADLEARGFCKAIIDAFHEPFSVHGEDIVIPISLGMTATADSQYSPEGLLREVSLALYRSKDLGGDRLELFDDALRVRAIGKHGTERLLRTAIRDRRVVVEYQPIVELHSGKVSYAEALVRLRDQEGGLLLPGSFLGIAAETGMIGSLDQLVMDQAVRQAALWRLGLARSGFGGVTVNVTSSQLASPDFPGGVMAILDRHGLPASSLHAEITEHEMVEAGDVVVDALNRLRACGVRVGLDDFGTGYSSLSTLSRLPLDFVKIDRSFVERLGIDGRSAVLEAIVELSKGLGLDMIAEGIETPGQLEAVRSIGVQFAQGYLFAPPGPAQTVDAMVYAGPSALTIPRLTQRAS